MNESNMFAHPGMATALSFRYLINSRWAIRALINADKISGTTADYNNVMPGGAHYEFNSWIYDLGARAEFNFFNYGLGQNYKQMQRLSPYLALGLGVALANPDHASTSVAMTIPMAFGLKFKLKPRLNLGLEMAMTKTIGDKADTLSDPQGIKSSVWKNTDWVSSLTLSITYEFGRRCVVCHRID